MNTSTPAPALQSSRCVPAVAFLLFVSLLVTAKMDLGFYSLFPLILMAAGASTYLAHQKKCFRDILFYAGVRKTSWLNWVRRRAFFIWILSAIISLFFILSVSIYLLTVHPLVLVAIAFPQLAFLPVRKSISVIFQPHLKTRASAFFSNGFTVFLLWLAALAVMVGGKYLELRFFIAEIPLNTSDAMATYVIAKVNHAIPALQHIGRTMPMFELELLRARELAGGQIGDLILIYYLLPSTFAAFALTAVHAGILFAVQKLPLFST